MTPKFHFPPFPPDPPSPLFCLQGERFLCSYCTCKYSLREISPPMLIEHSSIRPLERFPLSRRRDLSGADQYISSSCSTLVEQEELILPSFPSLQGITLPPPPMVEVEQSPNDPLPFDQWGSPPLLPSVPFFFGVNSKKLGSLLDRFFSPSVFKTSSFFSSYIMSSGRQNYFFINFIPKHNFSFILLFYFSKKIF